MQASLKDHIQLHFIVLLWGFTAILGVIISIPAVEIVFYRTLLASLALAGLLYMRKHNLWPDRKAVLQMLGTGAFVAAHWILFFASARISTVSVCLAGVSTATLWTSILEPIALKRSIRWFEVLLGLLVIFGLYLIFRFEFTHAWGLVLAILSAFFASLFTVINGEFTRKHNGYLVTFWEMAGATLSIALFFPFYSRYFSGGQGLQLALNWVDVLCLLALAVVCTVYAYSVAVELQKRISAFTVNLTINLEPVYGIILAILIFPEREKMTFGFYMGTSVILLAVLIYPLFMRWERQKQKRVHKKAQNATP